MEKQKLFQRDFTMVVIGQIISLFGNGILRFALPLYLLRETGSSSLFGIVTACSFIPMVIFSLFGGVVADRVNKRNIMVVLDFSTAFLTGFFYMTFQRLPPRSADVDCPDDFIWNFRGLSTGCAGEYSPSGISGQINAG